MFFRRILKTIGNLAICSTAMGFGIYAFAAESKSLLPANVLGKSYVLERKLDRLVFCYGVKQNKKLLTCNSANPNDPCFYQLFLGSVMMPVVLATSPATVHFLMMNPIRSEAIQLFTSRQCEISKESQPNLTALAELLKDQKGELASCEAPLTNAREAWDSFTSALFSHCK